MKALFSTALLWAGIFVTFIQGQELLMEDFYNKVQSEVQGQSMEDYTQNLNVYHQNELVAVICIKDEIPEYLIYKIEYQKDYNLIVEEVEGIVRYNVSEGKSQFDTKQSKAILSAQDFEKGND